MNAVLRLIGFVALWLLLPASPAKAVDIEPFISYSHISDLFKGRPFNELNALQVDSLAAGATLTIGKRRYVQLDMSHGVKTVDRGPTSQQTELVVRFYPGRLKR